MQKTVCYCDICNKEIVIKKRFQLGYSFKSYWLTNPEQKNKMDICADCYVKFVEYVKKRLREEE